MHKVWAALCACMLACSSSGANDDAGAPLSDAEKEVRPPCSDTMPCSSGLSCCNGFCTDVAKDPNHCGACGMACGASRFCTGMACTDLSLANLCANAAATVVLNGETSDDDAARAIANALMAACPSIMVRYTGLSSMDVLAADARPIAGPGDTLITAGGSFVQPTVRYMESSLTRVFSQDTENGARVQIVVRSSGAAIVDTDVSNLTEKHDYFLIQIAIEPKSGTLVLMTYGLYPAGTNAAGWFVKSMLMPQLQTYGDLWYVYEWSDTDTSAGPSAGDAFKKLGSGK